MLFWVLLMIQNFDEIFTENIKAMKMKRLMQTMKNQALDKYMQQSAEKIRLKLYMYI